MTSGSIDTDHILTPLYYYDIGLLQRTLQQLESYRGGIHVHYALKANADPVLLKMMVSAGVGADCVSGGEIRAAIDAGFASRSIVYAGIGKSDDEIEYALDNDIACFNVESEQELRVISEIAVAKGKTARVALRVNPHIDAHTNAKITTGMADNKFGIDVTLIPSMAALANSLPCIEMTGLHYHIGSQITSMGPFVTLCHEASAMVNRLLDEGIGIRTLNLGGGLGIDYDNPAANPIADFKSYFDTIRDTLTIPDSIAVHVELGRSIVAQCGMLVSRVLYIKQGLHRRFAIIDAGMNDLLRPALYGSHHHIVRLGDNNGRQPCVYDIVGPVCESSDTFATDATLPELCRGDLIAILSTGAYGQSMASHYNMRESASTIYSSDNNISAKLISKYINQLT